MLDFLFSLGNIFYEPDNPNHLSGWMVSEIVEHDKSGCPGRDFKSGRWGGLVCTTCGK